MPSVRAAVELYHRDCELSMQACVLARIQLYALLYSSSSDDDDDDDDDDADDHDDGDDDDDDGDDDVRTLVRFRDEIMPVTTKTLRGAYLL